MQKLLMEIPLSKNEDVKRFLEFYQSLISSKEEYKQFLKNFKST